MSLVINRDEAITLAKDYHARKFLETAHITGTVPPGTCYWCLEGAREDYWYIQVPEQRRLLQIGGGIFYYVISKETGKMSTLEFVGE